MGVLNYLLGFYGIPPKVGKELLSCPLYETVYNELLEELTTMDKCKAYESGSGNMEFAYKLACFRVLSTMCVTFNVDVIGIENAKIVIGHNLKATKTNRAKLFEDIHSFLIRKCSIRLGSSLNLLRVLDPYYSILVASFKKKYLVDDYTVPIMGVSSDTIYINAARVDLLTPAEFNFVLLHEIGHISGLHPCRRGRRDANLWNQACDYYINKRIVDIYSSNSTEGMLLGDGVKVHSGTSSIVVNLRMPYYSENELRINPLLITGLFDSNIDTNVDTPESIYQKLNQSKSNQSKSSQGQSGQGQSNQSKSSQGQSGQGQFSQGNSSQGQSGQGQFSQGNSGRGGSQRKTTQRGAMSDVSKELGKDLINSKNSKSEELESAKMSSLVQRAFVKATIEAGNGVSNSLRDIAISATRPKFNLRSVLREYLRPLKSLNLSYATPNKKLLYRNMVIPSTGGVKNIYLPGVKICIDTSGSISDKDLEDFFNLIRGVMLEYKVSGEIICWDTEAVSLGVFNFKDKNNSISEVNKKIKTIGRQIYGGGGTSPVCIFDYFESSNCKVKPYTVIVLTDGYICNEGLGKYGKKYRNTLWIVKNNDNYIPKDFKFGKAVHWKELSLE